MSNLKVQAADIEALAAVTAPRMTQRNMDTYREDGCSFERFLWDTLWLAGHATAWPVVEKIYATDCNDSHIYSALRHLARTRGLLN